MVKWNINILKNDQLPPTAAKIHLAHCVHAKAYASIHMVDFTVRQDRDTLQQTHTMSVEVFKVSGRGLLVSLLTEGTTKGPLEACTQSVIELWPLPFHNTDWNKSALISTKSLLNACQGPLNSQVIASPFYITRTLDLDHFTNSRRACWRAYGNLTKQHPEHLPSVCLLPMKPEA